jgi:hypothetical protein
MHRSRSSALFDAPGGKKAESMRPALESLMKTILGRLPR